MLLIDALGIMFVLSMRVKLANSLRDHVVGADHEMGALFCY